MSGLYLGYNSGSSGSYNLSSAACSRDTISARASIWVTPAPVRLPKRVGRMAAGGGLVALPRLQRRLQRHRQPQRRRTAFLIRVRCVCGALRHRHIHPIRRDEQRRQQWLSLRSATTRVPAAATTSGLGSALRINEYVGYSGTGTFTQSGGTNSVGSWYPLPRLQPGFQRQLQPQRLGTALGCRIDTLATPAPARLPSPAARTTLAAVFASASTRVPAAATTLAARECARQPDEYIGCSGSGTFTQSGGTNYLGME